ncbi:unnamed protein product [Bursaphelenchus xylophilus]|uniref:(pine wood nematode) hypothetical protein n=1 Tax=Bursaphelenchus xylophilus TaxID=6326 RepID=A0A1I7RQA8_BURXY|nr:unnamed protein product [Bursaphelenchus xylophilus]CAG9104287.1 unnamed protein product [Bursaphelenchus xylophilus]
MTADRVSKLEQELNYYKELYELEKETNELNDMKLKELNVANTQDRQKFEMERYKLKAEIRKLETERDRRKEDDSASTLYRQRIHQLEKEVNNLHERVRIAENMATKLEETCRAKDFEYSELQKDYELCLARCNALELQLMSMSQNFDSTSLSNSVLSLNGDLHHTSKGLGSESLRASESEDTPSQNGHPTPVPSPPLPSPNNGATENSSEENENPSPIQHLKAQLAKRISENSTDGLHVLKDVDMNMARTYCEAHPNDIDALLRFADLIRTIRFDSLKGNVSNLDSKSAPLERRSAPSPSRIPRAVQMGMDSLKDLQRRFNELTTNRPSA